MSGKGVRASGTVSLELEAGVGAATGVSGAGGKFGGNCGDGLAASAGLTNGQNQEACDELEGRDARNHDVLQPGSERRSRVHGGALRLAARQRVRRDCRAWVARRRGCADVRREARNSADLREGSPWSWACGGIGVSIVD